MLNYIQNTEPERLSSLQLEIPSTLRAAAWQHTQKRYSNITAQYNAYVNYVCVHTFKAWLARWLDEDSDCEPSIWPQEENLDSIWEFVNGTAIELGDTRIILIADQGEEFDQLRVPQEWVDIPTWAGDYYIALQMIIEGDDEKDWVNVWGFATHCQLKLDGDYSDQQRIYGVPADQLTKDLTIMHLTMGVVVKDQVPALPTLSQGNLAQIVHQLSDKRVYSPRLCPNFSFQEWGALLEIETLRKELCTKRIGVSNLEEQAVKPLPVTEKTSSLLDLRQWLTSAVETAEHLIDERWQALEYYVANFEAIPVRGTHHSSEDTSHLISASGSDIRSVLQLLDVTQPEMIRRQAAGVLGEIGTGKPEVISALQQLLDTAKNEETRWQAALSLGKLDPRNPQTATRKARLIDIGIRLSSQETLLVVSIMPTAQNKLGVFIQIFPADNTLNLPHGLTLTVMDESGHVQPGLEATAREQDKLLQLRFSPPKRVAFQVKVALGDECIVENFIA